MSNVSLADAVGLSASPCLQRVKRLEAAGIIRGYGAQVDVSKLVDTMTIFTELTLTDHRRENFVKFETGLRSVAELQECHLISGGFDYLLRFLVRSITHYQDIMDNLAERNLGIEKYFSYVVIKTAIQKPAPDIRELLDD